jgi:bacterioferritin-associated ferredoxin
MAAMYVCLCNGITERAVRAAGDAGARTLGDLQAMTGCATSCGSCAEVAMQVLDAHLEQTFPLRVFAVAA